MDINGSTQLYFIIADPIHQVRAPEVFNHVFAAHRINAALLPLRVGPDDLASTVRTLFSSPSVAGIFLSIPHKPAALAIVDRCSPAARAAGAVNAIRKNAAGELEGDLFDGIGFLKSLDHAQMPYRQRRVLVIGAGGAASAIATALAGADVASIAIYDPCPDKAWQLALTLCRAFGIQALPVESNDPQGYDLVVNASPLGLKPDDPLPVDVSRMDDAASAYDVLMKNQPTPFLRAVRQRGLAAEPGFDMLLQQTSLYLDFFGHAAAAEAIRRDDSSIRRLLYPAEQASLNP